MKVNFALNLRQEADDNDMISAKAMKEIFPRHPEVHKRTNIRAALLFAFKNKYVSWAEVLKYAPGPIPAEWRDPEKQKRIKGFPGTSTMFDNHYSEVKRGFSRTMNPERLAELRQKKALTVPPAFTLRDAVIIYLKKVGETIVVLAKQSTGQAPVLAVDANGDVSLSMYDPVSGEADILILNIDFDARILRTTLIANASQGGQETMKEWKLSRIQILPVPMVARAIYKYMF